MKNKRLIVAGVAGRVGGSIADSLVQDNEVFGLRWNDEQLDAVIAEINALADR